ncbi:ABC transporter permease [Luteimonas sp. MJ204]|uniref:ABC transporter permease n=1 Tax=Luteimonas sp. MJ145 TaxID=3129234 RepID=UPI0031BAD11F
MGVVRPLPWPLAPFGALGRYRDLTKELVRRDVLGRYRGANFGMLWSLIGPLMLLAIYTIAFGEILGSRWNQASGDTAAFGIVLFLGIIVHGFFAECFARSPRLMMDNANYVKRVVFPLDVLAWSVVVSALFHMVMNLLVFVVLNWLFFGGFSPTLWLLPVVLAPLVLLTVATCWMVSSLGVYIRDISQAVPVVVTALLFLSSAIVPVDTLPPKYQFVFSLNPLTFFIDEVREVALWGHYPDWAGLAGYALGSVVATYIAHAWFRITSKGFADVL